MKLFRSKSARWSAMVLLLVGLGACSGSDDEPDRNTGNQTTTNGSSAGGSSAGDGGSAGNGGAGTAAGGDTAGGGEPSGEFTLESNTPLSLVEGSAEGVDISFVLNRTNGHNRNVAVSVAGVTDQDDQRITFETNTVQLNGNQTSGTINIQLAIDDLPILSHTRSFSVTADDGTNTVSVPVAINVTPVNAPDIYLLVGQSNMVGFSGDGTKQAGPGGPDEPNPRIRQVNVSKNDQFDIFTNEAAFNSKSKNVIASNVIVQAEDPLHIPLDPNNTSGKDTSYIGLGLSFAKKALQNTEKNIILVPAAWSGSAFCINTDGPIGQWNAQPTDNPNLGNTWLFDRAVTRANIAIEETGGILRGILWHQGESDANGRCAGEYLANLERLAKELRVQIEPDLRGAALRKGDANIPFVLGTMSRGIDERGDISDFWAEKQLIDDAHRELPSKVKHAALTTSNDLTPANGYPCGNTTCIHYGPGALREMGSRYYDALLSAVANP